MRRLRKRSKVAFNETYLSKLTRLPSHRVALFGGIGCSGKAQYHLPAYGVHMLHGRLLPYATGAKLANPELTTIAVGGDGDGMAIGAGHFVNSGRHNVDLTYILFNNEVYALTKGQASPTLPLGLQPKSLPEPNRQGSVNALMLALTAGFTWIGRGYAFDVKQLMALIQKAIQHPGLAYLDVPQPCPTYNDLHTKDWFVVKDTASSQPWVYDVQAEEYDPVIPADADEATLQDRMTQFIDKAQEWGDRISTGVLLENRQVPTFVAHLAEQNPSYRTAAPVQSVIVDDEGYSVADLSHLFAEVAIA